MTLQACTPYERFLIDRIRLLEEQLATERAYYATPIPGERSETGESVFVREYRGKEKAAGPEGPAGSPAR